MDKIFDMNGSAATGINHTVTAFILSLVVLGEELVACISTNVAVDALFKKVCTEAKRLGLEKDLHPVYARLYSTVCHRQKQQVRCLNISHPVSTNRAMVE